MSIDEDDKELRAWGHTSDVNEYQKFLWALMYKKWLKFIGDIPKPSLDIGAARSKDHATVSLDPYPRGYVDVKGIGEELPFKNESFKSVILESVLKHVLDPSKVISEARRVVTKDGFLFLSSPVNRVDSHRYSFSSKSICTIIEQNGFKITKTLGIGLSHPRIDGILWRRLPRIMIKIPIPKRVTSLLYIIAKAK